MARPHRNRELVCIAASPRYAAALFGQPRSGGNGLDSARLKIRCLRRVTFFHQRKKVTKETPQGTDGPLTSLHGETLSPVCLPAARFVTTAFLVQIWYFPCSYPRCRTALKCRSDFFYILQE